MAYRFDYDGYDIKDAEGIVEILDKILNKCETLIDDADITKAKYLAMNSEFSSPNYFKALDALDSFVKKIKNILPEVDDVSQAAIALIRHIREDVWGV